MGKPYYIFTHFDGDGEGEEHAVFVEFQPLDWGWNKYPQEYHMFYATEEQLDQILRKIGVWVDELHATVTIVEI